MPEGNAKETSYTINKKNPGARHKRVRELVAVLFESPGEFHRQNIIK